MVDDDSVMGGSMGGAKGGQDAEERVPIVLGSVSGKNRVSFWFFGVLSNGVRPPGVVNAAVHDNLCGFAHVQSFLCIYMTSYGTWIGGCK